MSVATPTTPPATAAGDREIIIVSHSNLFYWWPVWAVGFLLGLLTLFDKQRMAIVPEGTKAVRNAVVGEGNDKMVRDVLVLPDKQHLTMDPSNPDEPEQPRLHMPRSRGYGVLFAVVLLLVIVITNVPMRGLWSVVIIVTIVLLAIIFHLADIWQHIFRYFSYLDIRLNAGGYFFISTALFAVWLITFWFFDRQIYMIFTPGQLKVCTEIGGGEHVYDAIGMTLEKQRSDLFRHWILGLGSGDLVVKTAGAQAHQFDLPNVLFIGKKVQQIEDMLKKKAVVETR
jgi:hypothetical protein